MKRLALILVSLVLVASFIAQPAMAADTLEPEVEPWLINEGSSTPPCTCGGENKFERWSLGYKVYLSHSTMSWVHITMTTGGITTLVLGLVSLFAASAAMAEVLMLVGIYLISGGAISYIGSEGPENGIIVWHCYFLPYPVYAQPQPECSYPHGGGGGGGGGGSYFFETAPDPVLTGG